jgi:sulfoxide reductase heme-binding subunit YedZ
MGTQPATRLSKPLGTSGGRWRRRVLLHHAPVALTSAVFLALFISLPPFDAARHHGVADLGSGPLPQSRGSGMGAMEMKASFLHQSTFATGYVALGLLGLTLLIGPANLLLRRRNPVSTYLARDVGTWTALFSVVHVFLAFVEGRGQILDLFIREGRPLLDSRGLGNWTGLAATVIVVGLLAISTDRSLRELKAKRWKSLQRLNYALFALVVLHAFFYGALLRVTSPFTSLLIFTVVAVAVGQALGIWLWRRRHARTGRTRARQPDQRERKPTTGTTR